LRVYISWGPPSLPSWLPETLQPMIKLRSWELNHRPPRSTELCCHSSTRVWGVLLCISEARNISPYPLSLQTFCLDSFTAVKCGMWITTTVMIILILLLLLLLPLLLLLLIIIIYYFIILYYLFINCSWIDIRCQ
jgi:hypothetical protein